MEANPPCVSFSTFDDSPHIDVADLCLLVGIVDFTEHVRALRLTPAGSSSHAFILSRPVGCTVQNPSATSLVGLKPSWSFRISLTFELPGYEPDELIGTPSLDLVHPDEFPQVKMLHYTTISQDQAAVLAYLRMKHKDPCKGYILCAIVWCSPLVSILPLCLAHMHASLALCARTSLSVVCRSLRQDRRQCTTRRQLRR